MSTEQTTTSRPVEGMVMWFWSLRWKVHSVWRSFRTPYDAGFHRFIHGRCLCGHVTKNEPQQCPIFNSVELSKKRLAKRIIARPEMLDAISERLEDDEVVEWD